MWVLILAFYERSLSNPSSSIFMSDTGSIRGGLPLNYFRISMRVVFTSFLLAGFLRSLGKFNLIELISHSVSSNMGTTSISPD